MRGFRRAMRETNHSIRVFLSTIRVSLSTMRGLVASIRETIKNYMFTGFSVVLSLKKDTWNVVHSMCLFCYIMEPSGIEPLTSCVQGRRSPS
jgi:hypothetical protein